jgi:hypothetical protein
VFFSVDCSGNVGLSKKTEIIPFALWVFYPFFSSLFSSSCGASAPAGRNFFVENELLKMAAKEAGADLPVVLVKWYEYLKWLMERIDQFPKNQRFLLGQRMTDAALDILELLVDASYSRQKTRQLNDANRKMEVLRWLVRLAKDRNLLSSRQFEFSSRSLTECGMMVGGWLKSTQRRGGSES